MTAHSGTACTAGQENTLILRIQIHHTMTGQHGKVDASCSIHSYFLVNSNDDLQFGVSDGIGIQKCQRICHGNTVISAQAGTLSIDIVSVHGNLQSFRLHINVTVRLLHRHHIHMSLQNHSRFILVTRSSLLYDNHIFQLILNVKKSSGFCKIHKIITDLLHIARTVGNPCNLLKIMKYTLWFQIR